jgi:hypothetical protein
MQHLKKFATQSPTIPHQQPVAQLHVVNNCQHQNFRPSDGQYIPCGFLPPFLMWLLSDCDATPNRTTLLTKNVCGHCLHKTSMPRSKEFATQSPTIPHQQLVAQL